MSILPVLDWQVQFLRRRGGGDVTHSWTSLLEHLIQTRELLVSWGADPMLCTAGLFHSVYGTESFAHETISLSERQLVRSMIGGECEDLVFVFSVMTKESFDATIGENGTHRLEDRIHNEWITIAHRTFRQLCNLSAANWLEQRPRLGHTYAEMGRTRYQAMLRLVLPAARDALEAAYGFANVGG